MVNFFDRLGNAIDNAYAGFMDHVGTPIKKGVLRIGGEVGHALNVLWSIDGYERMAKAGVSTMRMFSLIPACKGVFDSCMKTLEAQKDLCYATQVFNTTTVFIKETENEATGEVRYSFQLPELKINDGQGGSRLIPDIVKICYGIGNFFETGVFLIRYKVLEFPLCSKLANQFGSLKLFDLRGKAWTVNDIPVLNCWCSKPKDFFVFVASFWQTGLIAWDFKTNRKAWNIENLLKLAGCIGKMILISSGEYMLKKKYFIILTIVDNMTNWTSLFVLIIKQRNDRLERLNNPTNPKFNRANPKFNRVGP